MADTDTDQSYDERVAELDAEVFAAAARAVVSALEEGEGIRLVFQPGDATKYHISLEARHTITFTNGEAPMRSLARRDETTITFGTDTNRQSQVLAYADRIDCGLPWTNAVWRRLRRAIGELL